MARYIKVDKDRIPYKFDIQINKKTYTMEWQYNSRHDFFTVAISTVTDVLTTGEKLVLGKALLSERAYIPFPMIRPADSTGKAKRITWDNFGSNVLIYVGGDGE